jgi:hypothetical protein
MKLKTRTPTAAARIGSSSADHARSSLQAAYDDVVSWIPVNIVVNRLLASGQLP